MRSQHQTKVNPYATVIAAGAARYIVLGDRGTVSRIDTEAHPWAEDWTTNTVPNLSGMSSQILTWLRSIGFLIDEHSSPEHSVSAILETLERQRGMSSPPPSVHVFVSHNCNFRCVYCIQGHEIKQSGLPTMTTSQVASMFVALEEMYRTNVISALPERITIFGGEPLLPSHIAVVRDLLREAARRCIEVTVVTNGYFYDLFSEVFLCECSDPVKPTFLVSLDGPRDIHDKRRPLVSGGGTFDKIVENIDKMLGDGYEVVLQPIVDRGNGGSLEELVDFCGKRGWLSNDRFSISMGITMFPYAPAVQNVELSYEQEAVTHLIRINRHSESASITNGFDASLKPSAFLDSVLVKRRQFSPNVGCSATTAKSISFSPDGYIYPCREYAGRGVKYSIGQYGDEYRLDQENANKWFGTKLSKHPKCASCKFVLLCGGGCRVATESRGRSVENPLCPSFVETWQTFIENYEKELASDMLEPG